MPSTEDISSTRGFIYLYIYIYTIHFTLHAASHCACHSCLALAASNAGAEDQALLARQLSSALLCFACLLSRAGVSARVTASICLQPSNIHPAHAPNTHPRRHRHHPALPINQPTPIHPSAFAASLRQHHLRLCVPSPCIPIHSSQITPAAPRGGAATVTTAHPPTCCCLPPSISRRSRSAQGALTTA